MDIKIIARKHNIKFYLVVKLRVFQEELEELGIEDGDTVQIYGWSFEYYR